MSLELTVLILLIVGLAFMALEAFVPAFGLFGLGGAASFLAAVMMLRNLDNFMGVAVDAPLMISLGIVGLVVLAGSAYFAKLAWQSRIGAGAEILAGMTGKVVSWQGRTGRVHVDGEDWAAEGPEDLQAGDSVTVTARANLVLTVTKG